MTTRGSWSTPGAWRDSSRLARWMRLLRTRQPVTFNDKVRYKMLRDRRPILVTWADKAAMRRYVAQTVGAAYLPPLFLELDSATDLRHADLPESYVLKPTHGSGACVVVDVDAPSEARLPPAIYSWVYAHVQPEHAPRTALVAIAEHWLGQRYGRGVNHEWAYGLAARRLLVEQLLRDPDGQIPDDFKLFVFHGRCQFVQVDSGRFGTRRQDFFTRNWEPLALEGNAPRSAMPPPRPGQLAEMLSVAEMLARPTDFVRVDLYNVESKVFVGELTSSPAGGDSPFKPEAWNLIFGEHWTVPKHY